MSDEDFERELVEALPCMDKIAGLYVRSGDDRNDVVQEAAMHAWANRRQYREECKLSSWLHTIVRNVVFDIHRKKHALRRPQEVCMPDFFDAVDEKTTFPHEDWQKVEELIPALTVGLRMAVKIRLEGLNAGSNSTNKVRYHRAVLILRAKLFGKRRAAASSTGG